eukprot:27384-Eustigmatos_ZCMA.PRE.1
MGEVQRGQASTFEALPVEAEQRGRQSISTVGQGQSEHDQGCMSRSSRLQDVQVSYCGRLSRLVFIIRHPATGRRVREVPDYLSRQ